MKLKDLVNVIFDKVILYEKTTFDYTDLYSGAVPDIPSELLDRTVGIVGSRRKNVFDIELR